MKPIDKSCYSWPGSRIRKCVLLSDHEDGDGLRCVAKNDPKHIAEHEARLQAHCERVAPMIQVYDPKRKGKL